MRGIMTIDSEPGREEINRKVRSEKIFGSEYSAV